MKKKRTYDFLYCNIFRVTVEKRPDGTEKIVKVDGPFFCLPDLCREKGGPEQWLEFAEDQQNSTNELSATHEETAKTPGHPGQTKNI